MRNKTVAVLACLLFIHISTFSQTVLHRSTGNTSPVKIISQTSNSVTISLKSADIYLLEKNIDNTIYKLINMKKFGRLNNTGFPGLPYSGLKVATGENPNISVEIIDEETEILKDILVYPAEEPAFAAVNMEQGNLFRKNKEVYSTNEFYPKSPVKVMGTQDYHGVPITTLGLIPMKHNPVTKELLIYKSLVVKVTFSSSRSAVALQKNSLKALKNVIINPDAISGTRARGLADFEDDILIVTKDTYKSAAEELAVWHKMKGYDVKILSKSESWTTTQVDSEVKSFYNNASVKPGYLLIIGDHNDVPGEIVPSLFATYEATHATDNNYVCMGNSGDYIGEMARGRIAVSTSEEASVVVSKILKYEKTPPAKSSFYTNALACGYFQGYGDYYDNGKNVADRRFVQTAEEILTYLDTNFNINSDRIYCTKDDVDPMYWNDGSYSWKEPVPDHLRRPGFAWDGDYQDIANGLNDGRFLMYHYDHGYESGWGDPAFSSNQVKSLLANGDMLPLVYSIDCLVGKFNWHQDCFAEVITKKADGGAIGIVAATTLSSSGNNEALLDGMIDATWPGLVLSTPTWKDPVVTEHEPIYNMGDIMNQGFVRLDETWPYNNSYHNTMYHFFGDPTTPLWTEVPKNITKSNENNFPINAETFKITNLNAKEGIATLYDSKSDTIIGKAELTSNGTVEIPITCKPKAEGDSITLTIVSHNYIPTIEKIRVSEGVSITTLMKQNLQAGMKFEGKTVSLNIPSLNKASFSIFDLKGRSIYKWSSSNNSAKTKSISIDLSKTALSNGLYILKGHIGDNILKQKFNIIK